MKTKQVSRILAIALSTAALAVYGCGGGGGDGGGGAPGTKSPGVAAESASTAISLAGQGLSSIANPGQQAPRFEKKSIKEALAGFYKNLRASRKAVSSKAPYTLPCTGGGYLTIDSTDPSYFTITAYACVNDDITTGVRSYSNGTLTWSQTDSNSDGVPESFTMTFGSFTSRENRISDNRLLSESAFNMTLSGTFGTSTTACGGGDEPDSVTITMTGSGSSKEERDEDGTLDENVSFTYTNLTLNTTINEFGIDCEPVKATLTMSGGFSGTDNIESNDSESMSISSSNPLSMTWEAVTGGENITMSGTFTVDTACFDGTLTIATQTPIFTPDGSDCPISGVITVTCGVTATITYTATVGAGVQIDEGSDGTVDQTLPTCEDAEACIE